MTLHPWDAAYFESHSVDETTGLSYGMDMTPLMNDASLEPAEFVGEFIQRLPEMFRSE